VTPSLISRVEVYRQFEESCCFHNLPECLRQQVSLKRRLTLTFNIFLLIRAASETLPSEKLENLFSCMLRNFIFNAF
jgi:hypothetical protein